MRKKYLNYGWYFKENYQEKDLKCGNFKDFYLVNLPHTNKEIPLNNFDFKITNIVSIYKKIIEIKSLDVDNILAFEGVGHKAQIYVNGKLVCTHLCGYTQFKVNLNENGKIGSNEIAVIVDSREIDQPPFGFVIDYLCYGGIYRDVYLDILDKTHINNYYFHHDHENIYIDYELSNDDDVIIEAFIKDENDKIKLSCKNKEKLSTKMDKVTLWDIDNPHLYDLTINVIKDKKVIDSIKDKVGFRYIEFKENGFYLNGNYLKIRGLNHHQSYPYVGYAMPSSMQEDDANILKNKLCLNAVRLSHYPQSPDFLASCDKLGLLVFEEIPGWQHIGNLEWQDIAVNNVKEMIMRDRNHPSIMLWGVRINESPDNHDFYLKTNKMAHLLDPYRKTGGVRCIKNSELLEDVYTYNDFSYAKNGISLCKKENVTQTSKPYLVSEFGGHMMPTKSYDREIRRTDVAMLHASVLKEAIKNDNILGTFGWCFADYNTHPDFGSGDMICYHGVLDIFRNTKYSAYPYMTKSKKPFLEVTSNFNIGEYDGSYIKYFAIMTNCDKVEMYHNNFKVATYDNLNGEYAGIFKVSDLLGDALIKLEHKSEKESNIIKEIIACLIDTDNTLGQEFYDKYGTKLINEASQFFGKYVANWGSHPSPYTFIGYQNGKEVIKTIKGPQYIDHLNIDITSKTLHTKRSYDVTKVTIEAIGNLNNRCDFAFDAFKIETSKNLQIIGDDIIYLNSGIRSFYVKTLKKKGKGKINIISSRFGTTSIDVNIINK